ncbi:hypothetical protein MSUIS_00750 [Mycoplasma suis KI3806]|uniref:Uncharacterized protein n=1 Tax=Mycoplasma suis (strain KI_3806) TaxID=708248 RepID=F0V2U6_MYCS3|nr:hypothetical protein [Mycoplasma suis]CBZ40168.1 hypothetical protein MSUIS_00750 [Mycoplasma suis KI3806]
MGGLKTQNPNSDIQDQISSGEEQLLVEIDKQQREDEENIEKTCGEWSKYVGDSENIEKEIFRGNKEAIRKLIEGYGLENKLGNPSGNTVVGWKVEEGNCVEKDLRDGNIEITCQRISKE